MPVTERVEVYVNGEPVPCVPITREQAKRALLPGLFVRAIITRTGDPTMADKQRKVYPRVLVVAAMRSALALTLIGPHSTAGYAVGIVGPLGYTIVCLADNKIAEEIAAEVRS